MNPTSLHHRLNCVDIVKDGPSSKEKGLDLVRDYGSNIMMSNCVVSESKETVLKAIEPFAPSPVLKSNLLPELDSEDNEQYSLIQYAIIDAGWSRNKFMDYGIEHVDKEIIIIENGASYIDPASRAIPNGTLNIPGGIDMRLYDINANIEFIQQDDKFRVIIEPYRTNTYNQIDCVIDRKGLGVCNSGNNNFFKGNATKNTYLGLMQAKRTKGELLNANEIHNINKYILCKELGDTMQVILLKMLIDQPSVYNKSNTCIFTNDTILNARAKLMGLPVIILQNHVLEYNLPISDEVFIPQYIEQNLNYALSINNEIILNCYIFIKNNYTKEIQVPQNENTSRRGSRSQTHSTKSFYSKFKINDAIYSFTNNIHTIFIAIIDFISNINEDITKILNNVLNSKDALVANILEQQWDRTLAQEFIRTLTQCFIVNSPVIFGGTQINSSPRFRTLLDPDKIILLNGTIYKQLLDNHYNTNGNYFNQPLKPRRVNFANLIISKSNQRDVEKIPYIPDVWNAQIEQKYVKTQAIKLLKKKLKEDELNEKKEQLQTYLAELQELSKEDIPPEINTDLYHEYAKFSKELSSLPVYAATAPYTTLLAQQGEVAREFVQEHGCVNAINYYTSRGDGSLLKGPQIYIDQTYGATLTPGIIEWVNYIDNWFQDTPLARDNDSGWGGPLHNKILEYYYEWKNYIFNEINTIPEQLIKLYPVDRYPELIDRYPELSERFQQSLGQRGGNDKNIVNNPIQDNYIYVLTIYNRLYPYIFIYPYLYYYFTYEKPKFFKILIKKIIKNEKLEYNWGDLINSINKEKLYDDKEIDIKHQQYTRSEATGQFIHRIYNMINEIKKDEHELKELRIYNKSNNKSNKNSNNELKELRIYNKSNNKSNKNSNNESNNKSNNKSNKNSNSTLKSKPKSNSKFYTKKHNKKINK